MINGTPAQEMRDVHALRPHPMQPRLDLDEDSQEFKELVQSIKDQGIIEPLVITPDGLVLAGKRRRMGAIRAGLRKVPVYVREIKPGEHPAEVMLHENTHRKALSLLEEALSFQAVMEHRNFSVMELARHLSIPPPNASHRLAILKLPEDVRQMYHKDQLPLGAAPLLARVADEERLRHYAGMLARHQLTKDELKEIVANQKKTKPRGAKAAAATTPLPPTNGAQRTTSRAKTVKSHPESNTPEITRDAARAALARNGSQSIKLHTISVVFDQTCCACGMTDQADICKKCPLPRLISALVGRAS